MGSCLEEAMEYIGNMRVLKREDLEKIGFFDAPASCSRHLAEHGGLLKHSVNVTRWLLKLSSTMEVKWPRLESPYIVGMLHDIVKCECYGFERGGSEERIVARPHPYGGHGTASAALISSNLGVRLFPAETAAIIHHMGAFNLSGDELRDFDHALEFFPREIIATHTADMMAARVEEEYHV